MRLFQIGLNNCADLALHELFTASGVTSLRGSGIDWQETAPTLDRRNAQIRIDRNIRAGRHALDGLEEFDAFFDMEFVVNGGSIENFRHFELTPVVPLLARTNQRYLAAGSDVLVVRVSPAGRSR